MILEELKPNYTALCNNCKKPIRGKIRWYETMPNKRYVIVKYYCCKCAQSLTWQSYKYVRDHNIIYGEKISNTG